MTACPLLSYANVTPAHWATMKAEVRAQYGVEITTDYGKQEADGLTIEWNYSGYQTLTLQCLDSPFWVSCDQINAAIDSLIKQVLA